MRLIKHHEHQSEFIQQLQNNAIFFEDMSDAEVIELVTDLAHEAASTTKRKLRSIGAESLEEKAYWTTRCLRAHRSGARRPVIEAELAFPMLASCEGEPGKVHDLLRSTMNELLSKEFEDALHDPDLPQSVRAKRRASIDRRLALWRNNRKRVSLGCIADSGGVPSASLGDSAQALHDHWPPIFDAKEVDDDAIQSLLRYVQPWSRLDHPPPPSFDSFCCMLKRTNDSALGLMAFLFGSGGFFWIMLEGTCTSSWWASGRATPSPNNFNQSYLVFLPKVDDCMGGIPVEETRPLNLSNTDSKLLAEMVDSYRSACAQVVVHPAKQDS